MQASTFHTRSVATASAAVPDLCSDPDPNPNSSPDALSVLDDPVEQQRFTQWVDGGNGQRMAESSFLLSGMYCAACAGIIEVAVAGVPGVRSVQVSAAAQRALVRWDPAHTQASDLVRAVRSAGYDAVPDAAAPARQMRKKERRTALWRVFVASFCTMQVMMFATPNYVAAPGDMEPDLRQLLNWGSWLLTLPVLIFSAGPFITGAWRSLRQRRISMDVPVALGVLVTFIASTGATFEPNGLFGQEVYFDSMAMFVSFLLVGRFLELSARHRAAESLEKALAGMPETAQRLLADGREETVSVQRLAVGDRVRVALGAAFPADGHLEQGQTQADESLLTGESSPVSKRAGDELVGASVNQGAPVVMRVARVGADTRYEAIVAMMRGALTQRPAWAGRADRFAAPFLWAVLILAGLAAWGWALVDPSRAVWVAVSVLVVTCPCALSLAAPSALVAATGALARHGVMLQRLDALEALADMKRLFLDKTGTLTEDRPHRVATVLADGATLDPTLVPMAASLARWSSHPLAKALADEVNEGEAGTQPTTFDWQEVRETVGQGLEASLPDGSRWRLGSRAWVERRSELGTPTAIKTGADSEPHGPLPCVWFGMEGTPGLRFDFDERVRPEAQEAVKALQADGVDVGLLSGDDPARVARVAARLGLDTCLGGARPEGKLAQVAQAQARGERVGMVGDGVNDAPVLAQADISFAMGQGALVSRMNADAVIVSNRLDDVVFARRLARRTVAVVRQNLIWAALYNGACIPLALLGYLPPWAAGLGMAFSSLLVVGNSLRLAR